jgi:hypothetical protein
MPVSTTPTNQLLPVRIKKFKERNKGAGVTGSTKHLAYATGFAELCLALNEGEYTKPQLVEKTGLAMNTVVKWLNVLKRRHLIYVAAWTRPARGCPAAVFAWGYMEVDKPRPKPKSSSEYSSNYRNRQLERKAFHGIITR